MKMDCRQIEELMMDFLYQELDADQMAAYRAHLGGCAGCEALLGGYQRTREAVRQLPALEPSSSVTARLLAEAAKRPVAAVEASESKKGGVWGWITGWLQPLVLHPGFAAAAGVALVGGIAGFMMLRGDAPRMGARLSNEEMAQHAAAPAAPMPEPTAAPASPPPSVSLFAGEKAELPKEALDQLAEQRLELQDEGRVARQQPPGGYESAGKAAKVRSEAIRERKPATRGPSANYAPDVEGGLYGRVASEDDSAVGGVVSDRAPAPARKDAPQKPVAAPKADSDYEEEAAPVAAAPAPPPPAAEKAASAGAAPTQTESKKKTSTDAEARKLHGQARARANSGDCSAANALRDRIYRIDPTYFDKSVRNDADLRRCQPATKQPQRRAGDKNLEAPADSLDTTTK